MRGLSWHGKLASQRADSFRLVTTIYADGGPRVGTG